MSSNTDKEHYYIKAKDSDNAMPHIELAVRARKGSNDSLGLMFCSGYTSDMTGAKASRIFQFAQKKNLSAMLFDYRAHGKSGGEFDKSTIGDWISDAITVFEHALQNIEKKWVLVGSSMGAWIAAHILKKYHDNIAALLLIAPAFDFPKKLLLPSFPKKEQQKIQRGEVGVWFEQGKTPENGYLLTQKMLDEAENHQLLDNNEKIICKSPIRVFAGLNDDVVPVQHILDCFKSIQAEDALAIFIQQGDHSLSREQDLRLLDKTLEELTKQTNR